ncbi:MAG: CoA transferase [Deltaproteobacteria bacterium]|nr:CoA transferase [Deltaproteobacteria bacterium]
MLDLLDGIRVISFNHFLMGPVGIQMLADMGADVICIEALEGGFQRRFGGAKSYIDGEGSSFHVGGRNKRNIAVNLKHEKGAEIALALTRGADVVTENFRPGVMDRLGLGYNRLSRRNPKLIYAAATGFGSTGPEAKRPGQDLLIQALSGLAMITGTRTSGPRPVGVSAADHHGAALYALGILGALIRRQRTGNGCFVDVDLMSASINLQMESFVSYFNSDYQDSLLSPEAIGGWYNSAPYGIYAALRGHVAISHCDLNVLADALEIADLKEFINKDLFDYREDIAEIISRRLKHLSVEKIMNTLLPLKVWCAPINDYQDVVNDPQVQHNRNFILTKSAKGTPMTLVNHPIRYDGEVAEVRIPPQPLGAQSAEILLELGWDKVSIKKLVEDKVIALSE